MQTRSSLRPVAALVAAMLAPHVAFAQDCPAAPDHAAAIAGLMTDLQAARGSREAGLLSDALWDLWTDAPDARAQDMLDEGMRQRAQFDLVGARTTLDDLVAYCPDYAEGYNQRAFASYLQQDFAAALADLDRALMITPNHIGALSGKGLTLMGMGRHDQSQRALRDALSLNPWLSERSLIVEPVGRDI